jgi:hypothetical protein
MFSCFSAGNFEILSMVCYMDVNGTDCRQTVELSVHVIKHGNISAVEVRIPPRILNLVLTLTTRKEVP